MQKHFFQCSQKRSYSSVLRTHALRLEFWPSPIQKFFDIQNIIFFWATFTKRFFAKLKYRKNFLILVFWAIFVNFKNLAMVFLLFYLQFCCFELKIKVVANRLRNRMCGRLPKSVKPFARYESNKLHPKNRILAINGLIGRPWSDSTRRGL